MAEMSGEISGAGDDDSSKSANMDEKQTRSVDQRQAMANFSSLRYCPSRWLMAHHDSEANIHTMSSHMCLADLNNDGENLLALVDFKRTSRQPGEQLQPAHGRSAGSGKQVPPYSCRLRVYRGQRLIYNHFLDDVPSCLLATSVKMPVTSVGISLRQPRQSTGASPANQANPFTEKPLLALAIHDDVYFYHRLKPSHKLSLEDDERITDSIGRSEFDAWQMVRQNKVDVETLRELLSSLSIELGSHQLTSHTNNFLALDTNEDRKNYLLLWKVKKLSNGLAEHIMSMDSICCAAARLKFTSTVTRSGDFGQTRDQGAYLNNSRSSKLLDLQKDGLVLGTEDRHLLVYELRPTRAVLEVQYRLPAVADHLLVERRSPSSLDSKSNFKTLTYKILVSCRDCRIYSVDQNYLLPTNKSTTMGQVKELLALRCNVLDMCWTCDEATVVEGTSAPNFVVACLDRRIYCFSSLNGHCKWMVELELAATCLISIPISRSTGADANESNLIGVASQANRIDFYLSSSGLIVDSIYLGADYCQAMTFGRFGREDNCLCLVTSFGHLLIFILKRAARFANAQCLSSAAAHAADALAACSHISRLKPTEERPGNDHLSEKQALNLNQPVSLPSAFAISKASSMSATDQALDQLQSDHNCDQVLAKSTIDAHLVAPQLQVPIKSKDFVDQIVEQSRNSAAISKVFAKQMVKLRDKIKSTIEQETELGRTIDRSDGSRITLLKITGLGNTYRASLSLRLNLERHVNLRSKPSHLLREAKREEQLTEPTNRQHSGAALIDRPQTRALSVFLFESSNNNNERRRCQVKPFRFELPVSMEQCAESWIVEKTIELKLLLTDRAADAAEAGDPLQPNENSDQISLNVYALLSPQTDSSEVAGSRKWPPPRTSASVEPVFISSVNIPTC